MYLGRVSWYYSRQTGSDRVTKHSSIDDNSTLVKWLPPTGFYMHIEVWLRRHWIRWQNQSSSNHQTVMDLHQYSEEEVWKYRFCVDYHCLISVLPIEFTLSQGWINWSTDWTEYKVDLCRGRIGTNLNSQGFITIQCNALWTQWSTSHIPKDDG